MQAQDLGFGGLPEALALSRRDVFFKTRYALVHIVERLEIRQLNMTKKPLDRIFDGDGQAFYAPLKDIYTQLKRPARNFFVARRTHAGREPRVR